MYRYSIIIIMLIIFFKSADAVTLINNELPVFVDYYIQSEYRNDTIDYDETEKNYFREKAVIHFSRKSNLNLAYVFIDENDEKRFTWSLVLRDISPFVSFILGYYYVNFGNGLLIGKKRVYDPDVFSQRGKASADKNFSPCKSGNPAFAFRGISFTYYEKFDDIGVSISSFYSMKKRYIDEDSYDEGGTPSSLNSIECKSDKDYKYNEPVEVRTHGCAFALDVIGLFHIQLHYIYTDMHSYSSKEIYWDYEENGDSSYGISNLIGCGFNIQYSDDVISIFFEKDITNREMAISNDNRKNITGYGMLYGLTFKHPFLKVSLIGKDTEKNYYTPYGSSIGAEYPEKGWFFNTLIKPYRNIRFGTAISYERKRSTGSRDLEVPVTIKEKVYLYCSFRAIKRLDLTLRRVGKKESGNDQDKIQFRSRTEIEFFNLCSVLFSTIYQNVDGKDSSKLYTVGLKISYVPYFKSIFNFTKAEI